MTIDWRGPPLETMATPKAVIRGRQLEAIVGDNNFQDPWFLQAGYEISHPICVVPRLGTAFLISNDMIMSNWHVFRRPTWAENVNVVFNYEKDATGVIRGEQAYSLRPDIFFHANEALDYSICHVEGNPGDTYGVVSLEKLGVPRPETAVNIIQHPEGGAKRIAIRDNALLYSDDDILQYLTDTDHGSSGSPVFDDSWRLIGLHYQHDIAQEIDGSKFYYNEAINIRRIISDMGDNGFLP